MGLLFFFFCFPDNADYERSRDGRKKKLLTINCIDKRGFFFFLSYRRVLYFGNYKKNIIPYRLFRLFSPAVRLPNGEHRFWGFFFFFKPKRFEGKSNTRTIHDGNNKSEKVFTVFLNIYWKNRRPLERQYTTPMNLIGTTYLLADFPYNVQCYKI